MPSQESAPLLGDSNGGGSKNNNTYYFQDPSKAAVGQSDSVRDQDGGLTVEQLPTGADAGDFEPRNIGAVTKQDKKSREPGLFGKIFGGGSNKLDSSQKEKKMIKPRKAPIKVEPKVFFANERTFLAWMHVSILLAGASIAILAFSDYDDIGKQIYGLMTLPVAVAFIVYSMYQYVRRAYMIKNKLPGPYDDTVGPTVLGIMLMISITAQFAIKLMAMTK